MKLLFPFVLFLSACTTQHDKDRIAQLEKQTQQMQEQIKQTAQTADFDLSAKCGSVAKAYFNDKWGAGPEVKGYHRDYHSHYNKQLHKCFIVANTLLGRPEADSVFETHLYDPVENVEYGSYVENHLAGDIIIGACEVGSVKCSNRTEFEQRLKHYMAD